jgi:glycosyltransferase involved in cell wall biosynthesis
MNREHILQICPVSPVPVVGGRQLRCAHLLRQLLRVHEVHLLAGYRNEEERLALGDLAKEPNLTLEVFPVKSQRRQAIHGLLRPIASRRDPAMGKRIRTLVSAGYPIVKFDTLAAAAYLKDATGAAVCWLDQQNVECAIVRGKGKRQQGLAQLKTLLAARLLHAEEKNLVRKMDLVTAVSQDDAMVFANWGKKAAVIPNGVELPEKRVPSLNPGHLMFIGPMGYPPNWEGVVWFLDTAWSPIHQACPDCVFHVVGRLSEEQRQHLTSYDGVRAHGFMDSLAEAYRLADILVVPLLVGGGTKLKVLEAMAYGKAVIGTPIALHGLDLTPPKQALLAKSPTDFSHHVRSLLRQPDEVYAMGSCARQHVADRYTWTLCGLNQERILQQAITAAPSHRKN